MFRLGERVPVDHKSSKDVFTQLWGNYDRAMQSFLGSLRWDNKPLVVLFATPERAFAQINKRFPQTEVIPLTFSSLERLGPAKFDRRRFVHTNVVWPFVTASKPYKFVRSFRPRPVVLTYQWDVWARNQFDLDWVTEQLYNSVACDTFYITVEHPFPFGSRRVQVDLSDEPRDEPVYSDPYKQRSKRRTFTFDVQGWLCYPTDTVSVVETVVMEVWKDEETNSPAEKLFEVRVEDPLEVGDLQ